MSDNICFLCNPPRDLVYAESDSAFALTGLGPILPGYTVVATKMHAASAADVNEQDSSFVPFAESIRSFLTSRFGSCLLTEHGRMPVCVGASGKADPHCFHAHFLLFPGAPAVLQEARRYFADEHRSDSLIRALEGAVDEKEYLLISPEPRSASILMRPGLLIPQFARKLVADAVGAPELANWRRDPKRAQAVAQADSLRLWAESEQQ